jgi:hypothetical protein
MKGFSKAKTVAYYKDNIAAPGKRTGRRNPPEIKSAQYATRARVDNVDKEFNTKTE